MIVSSRRLQLRELLSAYAESRFLSPLTISAYETTIRSLERSGIRLARELSERQAVAWLRRLHAMGAGGATINKHRRQLLVLWRFGRRKRLLRPVGDLPRAPQSSPVPTAWRADEVAKILAHAKAGMPRRAGGWTEDHWRALVLVIYDTSLRIGCLLKTPRTGFQPARRSLYVRGAVKKGGQAADSEQRLHAETCSILAGLQQTELLFPWPLKGRRQIWKYFRRILVAAGLPATRRDLFHRLRRTSYTHIWALAGPSAASLHAGHSQDLSRIYLDRILAGELTSTLDVLPRPIRNKEVSHALSQTCSR